MEQTASRIPDVMMMVIMMMMMVRRIIFAEQTLNRAELVTYDGVLASIAKGKQNKGHRHRESTDSIGPAQTRALVSTIWDRLNCVRNHR